MMKKRKVHSLVLSDDLIELVAAAYTDTDAARSGGLRRHALREAIDVTYRSMPVRQHIITNGVYLTRSYFQPCSFLFSYLSKNSPPPILPRQAKAEPEAEMAVGTLGRLQEEAGGEAVRNYVTKGGEMRHVFQGYFETSHEVRTNKYNSQAWAVNFVATVVRHLESPRHWAAFVVRTGVLCTGIHSTL
jgi:hypothetical protein